MGGEKAHCQGMLFRLSGSPPRGRGKVGQQNPVDVYIRITPAWAGKRLVLVDLSLNTGDHPRVGGEKPAGASVGRLAVGITPA